MEDLIPAALSLIRSLCRDQEGWECDDSENLTDDPWDADQMLVFRRQDYVTCYVGFRNGHPLYVLQRIE
jgi:hypothetical protein